MKKKVGRPPDWDPAWKAFIDAYGGAAALADEMNVSIMTISRWARLTTYPHGSARVLIARMAEKKRLKDPCDVY